MLETERDQYKQEMARLHEVIKDLDRQINALNGNWGESAISNTDYKSAQKETSERYRALLDKVNTVERKWGRYRILAEYPGCKVKELTVDPGKATSKQYHKHRYELWFYLEGSCKWHQQTIAPMTWHQLTNSTDEPMTVIEVQYGSACEEDDIVRWEDTK